MKRFLFLLAALAAVVPLAAQDQAEPDERILAFDSHVTVNQDGSMQVVETIRVRSEGESIKHGIYREFPTRYSDRLGNRYTVMFDIVSLTRDGSDEPYHSEDLSNGVRVYFGSSSYMLPNGIHTYRFTYRTNRQLGFFKDHDELYWNVTGNDWKFPIDVATATIVLPENVRNLVTGLDGYTGYQGDKNKDFTAARDSWSNPVFRAEGLLPKQGLTIVVTWPKGLIEEPTQQQKLAWFLSDNKDVIAGIGGLAVVLVYFLVVWAMVGRDPAPGSIVPLYEPQDGLSAAGMRYLEQMGFDNNVFTAGILGLAAKGYLRIESDASHNYKLIRKQGYGTVEKNLSSDEKALAGQLFDGGGTLRLAHDNHSRLERAKLALTTSLHDAMEKVYFFTNGRYLWPGVALTALSVVALLIMKGGSAIALGAFMAVWLSGWTVGVCALLFGVVRAWTGVLAQGALAIPGAFFLTLFSLPFLAGECFGVFMLWTGAGAAAVLVIFAGIGINLLFHYLLKAPTRAGRQLMDRVEGFRMFLKAVDGDRLNRMSAPPSMTPELFERFLPYALALGVEHAWAQQFAQVLGAAAGSSGQTRASYAPSWYSGAGIAAFSASDFTSSFSSSFSSAVSSASAPASSGSGSGGGGSSGGGGGGGGGGGW
ncbi:MAG TPA: DUF2207 domain-containing protein [Candidatus Angelobacter sp.]|nr:DUF2207 domain-containing protein [Candidatus Angelobacter sp.]